MSDKPRNDEEKAGIDPAEEERMLRIMRYCDGVLPAREAAKVAEEIARDPAAARIAAEMSAGANLARTAWGKLDTDPVPLELARRVTQAAAKPAEPSQSSRVVAGDWRIAASLLIGALLGALGLTLAQLTGDQGLRLAGSDRVQSAPGAAADTAWQPALMTVLARDPATASEAFGAAGAAQVVSVARWFDTATGLRCAEFAKSEAGKVVGGGVACRKPDGGWDVIEQAK
jgi:anti-sigma factor RsiW